MATIRRSARVTAVTPVDGTLPTRGPDQRPRTRQKRHVHVDPAVMAAARAARRPGERVQVVDGSTVRLVPARVM